MDVSETGQAILPLHAPLAAAARLVADCVGEQLEHEEEVPLAVLEFQGSPRAAALFGSLLDEGAEDLVIAVVEVWVPLAGESEPYVATHYGHPLLRFLVGRGLDNARTTQALAFLICAQCEPGFMSLVSRSEVLGVGGAIPDDVDPRDPSVIPPVLMAEVDPLLIVHAELMAWRFTHARW